MGRGLGIFPARPKTPFVPSGATTRDKRPFCPGSWLHPGQKGAPYICPLTFAFLQHLGILDLRRAAVVSPIAPPAPPPSPSAARDPPPPRPGRLGRRPRQAAHRCAAVPGPVPPRLRRPGLHSARALVFAIPGGLHCTPPHCHPLRCAPPRRQLPASSSRAAAPRFPRPV